MKIKFNIFILLFSFLSFPVYSQEKKINCEFKLGAITENIGISIVNNCGLTTISEKSLLAAVNKLVVESKKNKEEIFVKFNNLELKLKNYDLKKDNINYYIISKLEEILNNKKTENNNQAENEILQVNNSENLLFDNICLILPEVSTDSSKFEVINDVIDNIAEIKSSEIIKLYDCGMFSTDSIKVKVIKKLLQKAELNTIDRSIVDEILPTIFTDSNKTEALKFILPYIKK